MLSAFFAELHTFKNYKLYIGIGHILLKSFYEFFQWSTPYVPNTIKRMIKILNDHIKQVN